MAELNKYSLYGLNYTNVRTLDELDEFVNNVVHIKEYDQVKDLLEHKWQDIGEYKKIDYPDLKKNVTLKIQDDRIEVRVFKNDKQTFGQYWQIVSNNEE